MKFRNICKEKVGYMLYTYNMYIYIYIYVLLGDGFSKILLLKIPILGK